MRGRTHHSRGSRCSRCRSARARASVGRLALGYRATGVYKAAHIDGMADAPGQWQPAMLRRPRALLASLRCCAGRGRFLLPVEELALFGGAAAKSAALEIGRCASGRQRRGLGQLAEVAKESGDAFRIGDERDHLGVPAAVLAGLEVDGERTPEQLDEGAVLRAMRRCGRRQPFGFVGKPCGPRLFCGASTWMADNPASAPLGGMDAQGSSAAATRAPAHRGRNAYSHILPWSVRQNRTYRSESRARCSCRKDAWPGPEPWIALS
jgi:hypothetical protein